MASDRIDEHNMDIGTPLIICEGGTALVIIFEYKPFEITSGKLLHLLSKIYQIEMRDEKISYNTNIKNEYFLFVLSQPPLKLVII